MADRSPPFSEHPPASTAATEEVGSETKRPLLELGSSVGRYMLVNQIGAGGMGVVFKAFDPELNRPVALKLLKTAEGEHAEVFRERLLREAQALAQLSHPNVVAVYDVGTYGQHVFVAMEFVEGQTLRQWLKTSRSTRAILDVFLAAGEGLAAAHRAGLVHRDFKPDNVMLGEDGRVRVLDFGLVRAANTESLDRGAPAAAGLLPLEDGETVGDVPSKRAADTVKKAPSPSRPMSPSPEDSQSHASHSGRLATPITYAGSVMGTPRYMSPEQHLADHVDHRSDQFSFCLALYEALVGVSPFADRQAAIEGRIFDPSRATRLSRWQREALFRGLAAAPDRRHPSMAPLLAALRSDPGAALRRRIQLLGVVALVGAAIVAWRVEVRHQTRACQGAERHLSGVWDPARRAALRAAFLQTGKPYAETVLSTVEHALDDYADGWRAMHEDACEATHVRHEQSLELLDLRMACLADRLTQLGTLTELYSHADEEAIERASKTVASLPRLDACADAAGLRAPVPPPSDPRTRQQVADVRSELARASAYRMAARYDDGIRLARKALSELNTISYAPAQAEAQLDLGQLLEGRGDYEESERLVHDAFAAALEGRHDRVLARSALAIMQAVSENQYKEGERWGQVAEAAGRRLTHDDEFQSAFYTVRSLLRSREGKYDDALADGLRALDLEQKRAHPDEEAVAAAYRVLGEVYYNKGLFTKSIESHQRSILIMERILGPNHPLTAKQWVQLGNVLGDSGQHEQSRKYYLRAFDVISKLNANHPFLATIHNNMGAEYSAMGRAQDSFDEYKRAYESWNATLGPSHQTAVALGNLGASSLKLNRVEDALLYFQQAVQVCEQKLGASHEQCGITRMGMSDALRRLNRFEESMTQAKAAVAIIEKAVGPKHPDLSEALFGLGQVQLERGAARDSLGPLDRALTIRELEPGDGIELADIRFCLAKALWSTGGRDRARVLLAQALEAYRKEGAVTRDKLATANAWAVEHGVGDKPADNPRAARQR